MKKNILLLSLVFIFSVPGLSQNWFTSFEVAKRMALVQDKMLFVMWEGSLMYPYYVLVKNERGNMILVDLKQNEDINEMIWEYFVPLLLPEDAYGDFLDDVEDIANLTYMQKLQDDSIKIIDVNGRILNVKYSSLNTENLSTIIDLYALNTSYINSFLRNYREEATFNTTLALASKYLDFAIFANSDKMRAAIVRLSGLYLKEANNYIDQGNDNRKQANIQKLALQEIKSALISSHPKKARRLLKKYELSDIDPSNKGLFSFLNYATFTILNNKKEAEIWEKEINAAESRKAKLIININ